MFSVYCFVIVYCLSFHTTYCFLFIVLLLFVVFYFQITFISVYYFVIVNFISYIPLFSVILQPFIEFLTYITLFFWFLFCCVLILYSSPFCFHQHIFYLHFISEIQLMNQQLYGWNTWSTTKNYIWCMAKNTWEDQIKQDGRWEVQFLLSQEVPAADWTRRR